MWPICPMHARMRLQADIPLIEQRLEAELRGMVADSLQCVGGQAAPRPDPSSLSHMQLLEHMPEVWPAPKVCGAAMLACRWVQCSAVK